jgi:hypothetical protein
VKTRPSYTAVELERTANLLFATTSDTAKRVPTPFVATQAATNRKVAKLFHSKLEQKILLMNDRLAGVLR